VSFEEEWAPPVLSGYFPVRFPFLFLLLVFVFALVQLFSSSELVFCSWLSSCLGEKMDDLRLIDA